MAHPPSLLGHSHAAEVFGAEPPDLDLQLWSLLSASAAAFPHREALVSRWQQQWTYRSLHERAERLARALAGLGCAPGMHLAAVLCNSAEWGLFLWAAARLGMVFVPMDARAGHQDLLLMLEAVRPAVLIVQDADLAHDLPALGRGQLRTPLRVTGEAPLDLVDNGDIISVAAPATTTTRVCHEGQTSATGVHESANKHDVALVTFTSGTTGSPKGCPHTSRNLVAQTHDFDPKRDPRAVDRWLVHTPVSHIFAINNALRAWRGGDAVVFPSPLFDVAATAEALAHDGCTVMSATPTLVRALLAHEALPPTSRGLGLSMVTMAGTCVRPEDVLLCRQGLGARDVVQAYGMSEGGPLVSWTRRDPLLADGRHPGVGKVLPGAAVRICTPGTREVLGRGDVGELHVGGPSVISGYLAGVDGASFYTDSSGSWLVTGDRGRMDADGVLHLEGRYKDLIIRGGENIHPARIEAALTETPDLQAQIIGIPNNIAGQLAVAVVSLPQGYSKAHVAEKARALGPRYALDAVYTLEELGLGQMPATSLGKPKKGILIEAVVRLRAASRLEASAEVSELQALSHALATTWEKLTGHRPSPEHQVSRFADSITLLRYCDSVLRLNGKRLYLQDLATHDTPEKQARLLLDRDAQQDALSGAQGGVCSAWTLHGGISSTRGLDLIASSDGQRHAAFVTRAASRHELWETAKRRLQSLGLDRCEVEDVVPIRSSFQRMISGQRPQSFHIRVVFRVAQAKAPQMRKAIEKGLTLRPILRTVSCRPSGQAPFHAVVKAHHQLFGRQIREVQVRTEQEAEERYSDDSASCRVPELMFSADIIAVMETGQCYLSAMYNHSVVDAVFLLEWHRDLGQLISGSGTAWPVDARSPYRFWADLWHQYQDSLPAQASVSFHVERLRGISRFKHHLWPPQRAPGWMMARDEDASDAQARRRVRDQVWHGTWNDKRASEFRYPRRSRVVCLPKLAQLRRSLGVEPALLARCAVAIFNIVQTASPYAVFNSWESGRSWPFVPGWMQGLLPPAPSIDGPTAERILNVVEVKEDETVRDFLQRMVRENDEAAAHAHVPWDKVVSELKEEGPVAVDASFRQSFVWDVSMGKSLSHHDDKALYPVARHDWADFGFCWNMFLASPENMIFIASWDTAQMNVDEVDRHCDCMAAVMRRLANEAHWDTRIGQARDGLTAGIL
ncbi:AMP-binding enzyme domain-containing protein [Hirsutella rhossiliensis]|uniref:AMP-binding enzyme domain-containing protein n=1 Tax=Hirsutella rhossiliensis TaxID=111463 RepID=A0A9P8SG16_9HYPO|nr:AMP-binding enzyme domain-containing protein [Hirsutella rhossiliensis]KAH0961503.1 AMP-binding enzyme domain-containing protein [Hirsutella rhossiliensis]